MDQFAFTPARQKPFPLNHCAAVLLKAEDASLRSVLRVVFCALLFAAAAPTGAAAEVTQEYQVKAVFLVKFAQFVEWPADTFPAADAPITIGVLGDDPFGSSLDETIAGETVNERKIVIQRSNTLTELKTCHMIFVSRSKRGDAAQILAGLDGSTALTVGDFDGFAQRGGMINFYTDGNKVRFEINTDAVTRARLKLSSQLLKLGKIVRR